jgi:hypothetical protein
VGVRFASLFILAVLCVTGAGGGSTASRVLWQGPLLAGGAVAWIEDDELHIWRARSGDRTVYRGDSLAVTRPFAASPGLLAFERSYPGCPPPPGHVCPDGTDALLGPLGGPFRALTRPRTCFLPSLGNALALSGDVVAFVEIDCMRQRIRVIVRDTRARVLRDAPIADGCCRDVAVAGRYVAWSEERAVVVYDRVANRIAYRARIVPAGIGVDFDFDLQRDGTLAVAFRLTEFAATGPATVGWFSPSSPRLHLLAARGSGTSIGIAGDRIAFERFLTAAKSDLVVANLAGRATSVARFSHPTKLRGFDFDGQRLAWASDRITARRVDCPPPGEGRPCVRRVTGVTTISRRTLSSRTTRVIARLRFEDVFGR